MNVTTMDTTSHNFTWQSWAFGDVGSSELLDVTIVDKNNIWVVGKIQFADTTINGYTTYNAVHWDGNQWSIKRIPFTGECSAVIYPPITSIFTFAQNDIWFASGGSLVHYNGSEYFNDCRMNSILAGTINKIWGISNEDLYIVGDNGTIVKYNGNYWWSLFSGTESNINDIWGIQDKSRSNYFILCAVSNMLAGGVFINNTEGWIEQEELPLIFTEKIRGIGKNDVFVVGHYGLIAHYNGSTWMVYPEASNALVYTSLDYKDDLMVMVGYTQDQAVIQFMIRNKK